jgi:hypothetical protein
LATVALTTASISLARVQPYVSYSRTVKTQGILLLSVWPATAVCKRAHCCGRLHSMADAPPLPAHEEELVLERGALVEICDGDSDSEPVGRAIVEHVYPRACMCNPLAGERFWCPAPGMRHTVYELHVYADEDADGDCDWADPNAWAMRPVGIAVEAMLAGDEESTGGGEAVNIANTEAQPPSEAYLADWDRKLTEKGREAEIYCYYPLVKELGPPNFTTLCPTTSLLKMTPVAKLHYYMPRLPSLGMPWRWITAGTTRRNERPRWPTRLTSC